MLLNLNLFPGGFASRGPFLGVATSTCARMFIFSSLFCSSFFLLHLSSRYLPVYLWNLQLDREGRDRFTSLLEIISIGQKKEDPMFELHEVKITLTL